MNEGHGTLKKLAEDAELYDNLSKASLKLASVLEHIDKGEGLAGVLVNDKELASELKDNVSELKELLKDVRQNPKRYFKFSLF